MCGCDVYVWNKSLKSSDLRRISSDGNIDVSTLPGNPEFSLDELRFKKYGQCIEHLSLSENDEIFKGFIGEKKLLLIEHKVTLESSKYFCKAFGNKQQKQENRKRRQLDTTEHYFIIWPGLAAGAGNRKSGKS